MSTIGQGLRALAAEIIDPNIHDAVMAAADAVDALQANYDTSVDQYAKLATLNQRLLDQVARRN